MIPQKLRKKLLEVNDAKSYPKWFRKVLARRLLLMLIPDRLSRNLPRWLSRPIFGDNAVYPADAPWPDWFVIPPDFVWPDDWLPWIILIFDQGIDPDTVFPADWSPGDALPSGVTLPEGYDLPATWTPYNPLPPGITSTPGFKFPPGWSAGYPLPPGVIVPPGVSFPPGWTAGDPLPPGVIVPPGVSFPPGWSAGYPLPPGVIVPPGVSFPPGWTAGDPLPPGVIVPPGVSFPPGWTAGDSLPPGVIVPPGVSFSSGWTAGDPLPPGVIVPPGVSFPPGWSAGDPLPPGVIVPPGVSFPPGWTAGDSLPPGVIVPPGVSFPSGWTAGDPIPDGLSVAPGAEFPPGWTPTDIPPSWIFQDPTQWVGVYDGALPPLYTAIDPSGPTLKTHTDGELPSTTVQIYDTAHEEIRGQGDNSWDIEHDKVNGFVFHSTPPAELAAYIQHPYALFEIYRSLWKFDLAVIPAGVNIEAGQFWIWGNDFLAGQICAQKAPDAIFDTASDYSKGEGDATLPQDYAIGKVIINLNNTILDYLNLNIGGIVYIMLLDYDYDYLNLAPNPGVEVGMTFDAPTPQTPINSPRLVLRYR